MSSRGHGSSRWKATYRVITTAGQRPGPGPAPAEGASPPGPGRRWLRGLMVAGIMALTGGVAFVGVRGYVQVTRLIETSDEIDHCRARLTSIQKVIGRLASTESGQRGYLLTGRPEYLARYKASREGMFAEVDDLSRQYSGREIGRKALERVRAAAVEKFAEMGRALELHDAGRRAEAIELVQSGVGERLKAEIFDLAEGVERAERDRLAAWRREADRYSGHAPAVLLALLGGTLVVVFGLCDAMAREVGERRRAEDVLRESEGRFRGSFEAAAVGMALVAPDGRFLKVNRALCEMLGHDEADLLTRDFQSITHPDDLEADLALIGRALDGEIDTYQIEKRYVRRDGPTVHAVLAVSLVRDAAGRPLHFVSQVQNITPRVMAERKAEEERRFIERIAGAVPSSLYVFDLPSQRNTWSNGRFDEVTGFPPEQLAAMGPEMVRSLVHPDDMPRIDAHQRALAAAPDGEVCEVEYRVCRADGSWRWLRSRDTPFLRDSDGEVVQVLGSADDITERRRAKAELARARTQLADAVESLDAGLVMFDADERLVICNERFRAMYPALADLMTPGATYEAIIRAAARAYPPDAEGGPSEDERVAERLDHFRHRKGSSYEVGGGGRWSRIGEFATSECGTVCLITDITDLKRHEEELRRARDEAQTAARVKAEFLANMSHEIRTPMNGVLGMAELALGTTLTPRQREYVAAIKSSAEALLTVINDVLDFSKIDAGKLELDRAPFGLRALIDDTLRTFAPRADEKGLELCARVAPAAPDVLLGDPHRLRQVLVNLVGNAIKFTEAGEVVVSIDVESGDAEGPALIFAVRDTGIGIPADRREAVFRAFEQADGSTTRRYGGTGLGLTISARLVAMMGGRIWVEENLGGGSVFQFTARFGRVEGAEVPPTPASLAGRPVLVVDDHATGRAILAEMLAGWRMEPMTVADVSAAVEACRLTRAAGRWFAAAVVDGEPAARALAGAGMPIVLLSSGTPNGGDAGAAAIPSVMARLAKPVRQSELFNILAALLGGTPAEAIGAAVAPDLPGPSGRSLRILLAEDHPVNQVVATHMLERLGHRAVVASDGRAALAAMESGVFDMVLMDLQMPVMDGFEALAAIRDRERFAPAPRVRVVALTAHALVGDRERCLAAGFDGYLAKPIRGDDLARALAELSGASRPLPVPPMSDGAVFRAHVLVESCDGDPGIIAEVLDAFLEQAPDDLDRIVRALAEGDLSAARRAAHGMKGACATVGAETLAAACRRIEQLPGGAAAPDAEAARLVFVRAWSALSEAIEAHREALQPARA